MTIMTIMTVGRLLLCTSWHANLTTRHRRPLTPTQTLIHTLQHNFRRANEPSPPFLLAILAAGIFSGGQSLQTRREKHFRHMYWVWSSLKHRGSYLSLGSGTWSTLDLAFLCPRLAVHVPSNVHDGVHYPCTSPHFHSFQNRTPTSELDHQIYWLGNLFSDSYVLSSGNFHLLITCWNHLRAL
jgi:hypothetical protein